MRRFTGRRSGVFGLAPVALLAFLTASAWAEPPPSSADSGQELVLSVLATLQRAPSLSAGVRYTTSSGGDELLGTGRYLQRGTGRQRRSRLELQSKVAGETASMEQVFDGAFLWTDKRLPSGRTVSRSDVERVLAGLRSTPAQVSESPYRPDPLVETALARGGLPQLVADLLTRFRFEPPRQAEVDGETVWAVLGRWDPEARAAAFGDAHGGHVYSTPHHVLLMVGVVDRLPRVVEYRGVEDAELAASSGSLKPSRRPLVRYQFFEVRLGPALGDEFFRFVPGEVLVVDHTPLALARVRELSPAR